ncbi:MAG: uroporphyrinogen-III C-methyltransferase, partial [Solirubrobacterales bacterium]|nr:uroporphyrinogen-III C-methyltransferase [Solirubrobacterales bacterium]
DALAGARDDCDLRYAGKAPGDVAMTQEEINDLLVELGRAGKRVVRLKGGDPFVFGRGGEEAEALRAAGVAFDVVPGVTAGVAASAYAGIPVTHRDAASAVAFVTGHEGPGKEASALDADALAAFPGTLVFYMGVRNLPLIADALVAAGRDPAEPAAVVRRGTLPDQRTVTGTLADIAERVADAGLKAPAITVIGPAAALRDSIAWFERRPLHGRRVAVTRARAQASGLASRLAELGAEVVETPAIRIEPRPVEGELAAAVDALAAGAYDLVCLTSANGVRLLFDALAARGPSMSTLRRNIRRNVDLDRDEGGRAAFDARALAGATVAAIGAATERELAAHGIRADVLPERAVAEGLVEALADIDVEGRRVLIARAGAGRDLLPDALAGRGALVDVAALYDTVVEPLDDAARTAVASADYVTFTSASTVRKLVGSLGGDAAALAGARAVSIGPITTAAARELGVDIAVEADRHDVDGLIDALLADAGSQP